jgi:hypothetical protein
MKTPTLTPAEVARSYIERFGTPAVPCRGKRSLSKWSKPEGRASTTEEVDPLFNQYRHADGVALLLGGDGLFVVDTDSDAAHLDHETWRKKSSVQDTRTHTSPGGGERRHYWYRAPEGVTPPGKNRKDYGDIKATGGYVLAPGLERGRQVELDVEPVQLTPEQYEALYALFGSTGQRDEQGTSESDVASSPEAADEALLAIPNTEDTSREEAIGMLHRARTAGCTDEGMMEWLSRYPYSDPEEDARMIATLPANRGAGGYSVLLSMAQRLGDREPTAAELAHLDATANARAADVFEADPDAVPPTSAPDVQHAGSERGRDLWSLRELVENPENLQRGERLSPSGMQHRGELCLIAGLPKIGKSLLCTWEAAMASKESCTVLWASYEESLSRITSRLLTMGADRDRVHVALFPKNIDRIAEIVNETGAECVWIDSGASYVSHTQGKVPGTEQGELWQGIYGAVQTLAIKLNVGITILVHSPKGAPGEVRGSTGAVAAADAVWKMTGSAASQRRKVSTIGRWDNEELSFVSDRAKNPTGFTMEGGFLEMSTAARCFTFVQKSPGCSTREVRNEVGGKSSNVAKELQALEAEGFLADQGDGNHHRWTAVEDWVVSADGQRIISQSDISELDTEVAP